MKVLWSTQIAQDHLWTTWQLILTVNTYQTNVVSCESLIIFIFILLLSRFSQMDSTGSHLVKSPTTMTIKTLLIRLQDPRQRSIRVLQNRVSKNLPPLLRFIDPGIHLMLNWSHKQSWPRQTSEWPCRRSTIGWLQTWTRSETNGTCIVPVVGK